MIRANKAGGTIVCQEPDGPKHGLLHRQGDMFWIAGHDTAVLNPWTMVQAWIDDLTPDPLGDRYVQWWVDNSD